MEVESAAVAAADPLAAVDAARLAEWAAAEAAFLAEASAERMGIIQHHRHHHAEAAIQDFLWAICLDG